jgi:hypothetical protein
MNDDTQEWRLNYFNYFTEVEEHFQRARGSGMFLLSPLDWAIVDAWKSGGVPLEAVLRGIDAAFEKWRQKKNRTQAVNSLAYCVQPVMKEAERMANNQPSGGAAVAAEDPFPPAAVRAHLEKALAALGALAGYEEIVAALERLLAVLDEQRANLQELDQRLTAIEEKMAAIARTRLSEEDLFLMRRELDRQLAPYRSKLSVDQLMRLEKSFLDRKVYEKSDLPRLSLFFLA